MVCMKIDPSNDEGNYSLYAMRLMTFWLIYTSYMKCLRLKENHRSIHRQI